MKVVELVNAAREIKTTAVVIEIDGVPVARAAERGGRVGLITTHGDKVAVNSEAVLKEGDWWCVSDEGEMLPLEFYACAKESALHHMREYAPFHPLH